jgi:hypothetical protein
MKFSNITQYMILAKLKHCSNSCLLSISMQNLIPINFKVNSIQVSNYNKQITIIL